MHIPELTVRLQNPQVQYSPGSIPTLGTIPSKVRAYSLELDLPTNMHSCSWYLQENISLKAHKHIHPGHRDQQNSWFLVHPASKTHWTTRFLQLLLSSAASSTSSQLMPIFLRSFLMTSFQFCRGRPGLLLKPSGSHVRACCGCLW